MKQKLTENFILREIEKCKRTFQKSNRPEHEKTKLNKITVVPHINHRLGTTWGRAYLVNTRDELVDLLDLKDRVPFMYVQGRMSWFILEMNPLAVYEPLNEVCDTVSHELAHLLDFCFEGYYTRRNNKGFHHRRWKDIHRAMGGTGEVTGRALRRR